MVLYSRLGLLIQSRRIRRFTLAMIIIDGVCLHTSTVILILGTAAGQTWNSPSLIIERVHIVIFALQEAILTFLCTKAALDQLRAPFRPKPKTKQIMKLVIGVQLLVVSIDIIVVVFDCAGYFAVKSLIYPFTYAIKLELEFIALNQLVAISRLGLTGFVSIPPESELRESKTSARTSAVPAMVSEKQSGFVPLQQTSNSSGPAHPGLGMNIHPMANST